MGNLFDHPLLCATWLAALVFLFATIAPAIPELIEALL